MAIEIFMSYRRVETELATTLQARLEQDWGFRGQIFRDTSTPGGERWETFIFGRLSQSRVMLALVGANWTFQRPGADPDHIDYVQREFEHAAKAGTPILIVEVGRDGQHAVDALPPSLRAKQSWQTCRVSAALTEYDLRQVAEALKRAGVTPEKDSDPFTVAGSLAPPEHESRLAALVREAQVDDACEAPVLIVTGSAGLGRNALVRSVAHALERDRLVLGADYDMPVRHRSFAVLANWFADLVTAASSGELADCGLSVAWLARHLVTSGRDLLSRSIVAADQLADLGDDDLELAVVHAAGRVDARHAAFNPQRIRDQALAILRAVHDKTGRPLLAVVGDLETVDRESLTTLAHLRTGWDRDTGLTFLATCRSGHRARWERVLPGAHSLEPADRPAVDVLQVILAQRGVHVEPAVLTAVTATHASPFLAVAALKVMADRGDITGPVESAEADPTTTAWRPTAGRDATSLVPARADIMDHLVEASSPLHLRPVLDIGALMGAPFPYDVAHAVAFADDPASGTADGGWNELVERAAQVSIVRTQVTADGQRWVSLHRDLASHLTRRLTPSGRRAMHARIATRAEAEAAAAGPERRERRYGLLALAAEQWTAAREVGKAAVTHRTAAELAEELLASDLAIDHYRRARLAFDQARRADAADFAERFGYAHCEYRLGRLHLLAGESCEEHFVHALEVLRDVQAHLRNRLNDIARLGADGPLTNETGELRDWLRRCASLAAYVEFSMAEQSRRVAVPRRAVAADLYCEALQQAEAARSEADSRWIVAAASARLADLFLEEAADVAVAGSALPAERDRLDMLRRNVTLHAERALRVRGLTTTDEERLAEPRAWAFEVLGRLHQWIAVQPAVAAGFFRRMNDNSAVLDDATDRTTDLSHALFLLSLVPCDRLDELAAALAAEEAQTRLVVEGAATAVDARSAGAPSDVACIARLLYDALRWTEATRAPEHRASAHACLAVAWFAAARGDPAHPGGAWAQAHRHAVDAVGLVTGRAACRRRILLFCGLVLELGDLPDAAVEAYASGLALERGPTALAVGHRAAVGRLLLELPALALDGVGRWVVEAEHAEAALERAARYRERAGDRPVEDASFDEQVWQLAESRLPAPLHRHSTAVRAACEEMAGACWGDPTDRMVIVRDLALAAGLHDWFSDVDPARLLVLAREWDLPISGVEWANPVLLHGRLAVEVARALYDAEIRLGTERFRRIERIVLHHTVGACDATLAEKVFALADWRSRQPEPRSTPLPSTPHAIDIAYRQMFADKADQVRRRGGILAPQTDDLVASAA